MASPAVRLNAHVKTDLTKKVEMMVHSNIVAVSTWKKWREFLVTHIVNGKTVTEDEVDAPLDVTILEVMAAVMVIQRVLVADDGAVVERCVVGGDAKRHCLHANSS